jgi:hypothetical protein
VLAIGPSDRLSKVVLPASYLETYDDIDEFSECVNSKRGLFSVEKETIVSRTPPPEVHPRTERPVRTRPMEKAKKLIRKTSAEHAGLFLRLSK